MKSLSAFIFLAFSFQIFSQTIDSTKVAVVNGDPILKSTLEETFKESLLFLSQKKVTRPNILEDLINRQIGIQKAKKNKLEQDPVVARKIEDLLFHAQLSKDMEPILKKITVTDADLEEYYKTNKEYRTAHILFRLKAEPTIKEVQETYTVAMDMYTTLVKSPEKFSDLAKRFSQSTAAPNGGDLGFQVPPRLAPEYYAAINGKKIGFITPPIRTQFGYHIIKILEEKPFEKINKNLYRQIVFEKKRDQAVEKYFADARKNSSVIINSQAIQ